MRMSALPEHIKKALVVLDEGRTERDKELTVHLSASSV